MNSIDKQGNLHYDCFKSGFDGNVQGIDGICQCVTASNGGGTSSLSVKDCPHRWLLLEPNKEIHTRPIMGNIKGCYSHRPFALCHI